MSFHTVVSCSGCSKRLLFVLGCLVLSLSYSEKYVKLKKSWVSHSHTRTFLQALSIYWAVCGTVWYGCLSHTKRPEALGRKFSSLLMTVPQQQHGTRWRLSLFHCWPHCVITGRLSGLPFLCVCIHLLGGGVGVQLTFHVFYPTTTAMHQPGSQLHRSLGFLSWNTL